jgi:hypothetical protein
MTLSSDAARFLPDILASISRDTDAPGGAAVLAAESRPVIDRTIATQDSPCDEVHFEIGDLERRTSDERPRRRAREPRAAPAAERFHQIVISPRSNLD